MRDTKQAVGSRQQTAETLARVAHPLPTDYWLLTTGYDK